MAENGRLVRLDSLSLLMGSVGTKLTQELKPMAEVSTPVLVS